MSPANLTLLLLRNNNITDGTTGWTGTYGIMPDKGDQIVTIYDTDSQQDGRGLRPPYTVFQHPGISFMIRSASYDAGWNQTQTIQDFLASVVQLKDLTIGSGVLFGMYHLKHGFSPAGREKSQLRYFFTAYYTTIITEL